MSKKYQPYQPSKWEQRIQDTLAIVSPTRALNRIVKRERIHYFRYMAAQSTSARPNSTSTTAGEWLRIQREKLQVMWNAIDMVDNSGLCSGILIKFPTYVCGTLTWQARTGDKSVNAQYQQYIKEKTTKPGNIDITKRFTLRQMCMLDVKCIALKGDVGTNIVRDGDDVYLQGIEANRIGDPYKVLTSQTYVRGLVLKPTGEIEGAQIFYQDRRSGTYRFDATYPMKDKRGLPQFLFFTNPIPISFDDYRGVSLFKHAIDNDTYITNMRKYELQALMWASSQSGVYHTKSGALPESLPFDRNRLQDKDGNFIDTYEVRPNTVTAIGEGEDIAMFQHDRPSPNVIGMYENTVRDIAIGAGLTYGFTYDMAGLTGPAVRQCSAQDARAISVWQEMLKEQKLDQVVMLLLGEAIAKGDLPYHPNWLNWNWFFPAKPTIDVGRESDADINEINAVVNTGSMVVADGGRGDIEDVITQRSHEIEAMIEAAQKVAKGKGLDWKEVYSLMVVTKGGGGAMQQSAMTAAGKVDGATNKDKKGATDNGADLEDESLSLNGNGRGVILIEHFRDRQEFDKESGKTQARDKGRFAPEGGGVATQKKSIPAVRKTAADINVNTESGEAEGKGWQWHYAHDKSGWSPKARMLTSPEPGNRVAVRLVETALDERGKGYASALLEHAVAKAKESGASELISDPQGGTTAEAGRLWDRMGADKIPMKGAKDGTVYRIKLPSPELSGVDKQIIDYKPGRRPLTDPSKQADLAQILPHTRYVPYSKLPFFKSVSAMQGVLDTSKIDGAEYKKSRDLLFNAQPVVDVPLDNVVVTQPHVNKERIAEMGKHPIGVGEEGTELGPIQAVRYNDETYIMNGHHRSADYVLKGEKTIRAHVLTISDDEIAVYESSANAKPSLDKLVGEVAAAHKASPVYAPLKSLARTRAKVKHDYNGEWARIKDVVRGRVLADDDAHVDQIAADLEKRLGIKPKVTKDSVSGFRDYKFNPEIEGRKVEIAVLTKKLAEAADKGHVPYEKSQAIQRKAMKEKRELTASEKTELDSLNAEMAALFGQGVSHSVASHR